MIKLIDIVKEVQASDKVAVEEVNIGKLARTAATTAAIGLASLGAPKGASAQVQKAPTSITAPVTKSTAWKAERHVSNEELQSWNKFQKWLSDTTFEDMQRSYYSTDYKASGKLAGNKIMNQPGYSNAIINFYSSLHRDYELSISDIKNIQTQIKDYGNWLASTKQNPELQSAISKMKVDGIVGEVTSTISFPEDYIKALNSKVTGNL